MIRSSRIPPLLDRICDNYIQCVLLLTLDGELLGTNSRPCSSVIDDPESFGTLVTDIAMGFIRLGDDFASIDSDTAMYQSDKSSHMQCLLLELEMGIVGVSVCLGTDCFLVVAVAHPNVPHGLLKARLEALAAHVQESFATTTTETSSNSSMSMMEIG